MVVADGRSKEDISRRGDGSSGSTPQYSAEAKRLEARRRFLLGGAVATPILVTVTRANAVGFSRCFSIFGTGTAVAGITNYGVNCTPAPGGGGGGGG